MIISESEMLEAISLALMVAIVVLADCIQEKNNCCRKKALMYASTIASSMCGDMVKILMKGE